MIEQFLRFDISLFSIMLLTMILFLMRLRKETVGVSTLLFKRIVWINILMLILEIFSWQFDHLPGRLNYYLNYGTNMIFAWSMPLITTAWATYVDFKIFGDTQRLKRRLYYLPIMIINTVLIGINFFVPVIFSVDQMNVYSREPLMWLIIILNSGVLIYISALAYKHRREIQREVVFSILLFVVVPSIAAGLQVMIFGAFIMWPTMAVIVVITYIFNETVSTSHDYITGLYSRIRVDQYIERLIVDRQSFGVMMIDLNDFKKINDIHGHRAGDKTLAEFGKRLQEVFGKEKIVARYGGDEFIIVSKVLTTEQFEDYMTRLKSVMGDLVGYSIGYHDTNLCNQVTYEDVVNCADSKMYIHKASFKNTDK